jgi:hypothetical protein
MVAETGMRFDSRWFGSSSSHFAKVFVRIRITPHVKGLVNDYGEYGAIRTGGMDPGIAEHAVFSEHAENQSVGLPLNFNTNRWKNDRRHFANTSSCSASSGNTAPSVFHAARPQAGTEPM